MSWFFLSETESPNHSNLSRDEPTQIPSYIVDYCHIIVSISASSREETWIVSNLSAINVTTVKTSRPSKLELILSRLAPRQGDFICDNNEVEYEREILKNKPCEEGKYELIEFVLKKKKKKKKKKKFTVCLCWALRHILKKKQSHWYSVKSINDSLFSSHYEH